MSEISSEGFAQHARVLEALASETRLRLVDCLSHGELSVAGLASKLRLQVSTASKNLAVLRTHGIVSSRRGGNHVFYSLSTPCVMTLLYNTKKLVEKDRW